MKYIKKISSVFCAAALGLLTLTGCEGADIFSVDAPDWIQSKADSIAAAEAAKTVTVVPTPTTLGALDCTTAYLGAFSDTIKIEDGKTYVNYFTNLSSCGGNWNNFVIILRGKDKTTDEAYAVLRADNWANIPVDNTDGQANLPFTKAIENSRDWNEWKEAMNGAECVCNVKSSNGKADVSVIMNGNNGKTYTQSYTGIPIEKDDLYLVYSVDKSAMMFNDGSEVKDYEPTSLTLNNVPATMTLGENLDTVMTKAGVTATVIFGDNMTKTVSYSDLVVTVAPDLTTLGQKYLVASYAKTFNGQAAKAAIHGNAQFTYGGDYTLEVTTQPTHKTYYINSSYTGLTRNDVNKNLVFDPTGLVVSQRVGNIDNTVDNSKLKFTSVPAEIGTHTVTITDQDGKTTTVQVEVKSSSIVNSTLKTNTVVGKVDNSGSKLPSSQEQIAIGKSLKYVFINYGKEENYQNFLVEVCNNAATFIYTLRADNWGWGTNVTGANFNDPKLADWPWGTDGFNFHSTVEGANVTVYVTNLGNGSADVECLIKPSSGSTTYHQAYYNLTGFSADNIWSRLNVDGSHLVIK